MTDTGDDFRSLADAERAIADLTAEEVIKLRLYARYRLIFRSHELTEDELISEAVVRTLDGIRRWNKKLGVLEHLIGAMRSIAGDQRRSKQAKSEIIVEDVECARPDEPEEISSDAGVSLESEQTVSAIFEAFEGDYHSSLVIQGIINGEKRREALARTDMSEKEYGAARKRIVRKLIKMKEGGQI